MLLLHQVISEIRLQPGSPHPNLPPKGKEFSYCSLDPPHYLAQLHQLAQLLEDRIEFIFDTDKLVQLYERLGDLYGEQLKDSTRAAEIWEKRLELSHSAEARETLYSLYRANQDWERLVASLNDQIGQESSSEGKLDCLSHFVSALRHLKLDMSSTPRNHKIPMDFHVRNACR